MTQTTPDGPAPDGMRLEVVEACPICATSGDQRYVGLRDKLFGVSGLWNLDSCRNPECGSVWLNPRPSEEDIAAAYRDYYTHSTHLADGGGRRAGRVFRAVYRRIESSYLARTYGYWSVPSSGHRRWGALMYLHPGWRADADFKVMYLPWLPEGKLLDVGCGDGRFIRFMAELGWKTKGIDNDPEAIKSVKAHGSNVVLASPRDVRDDEQYDAVTLSHVIEHVHDPASFLKECRRLLRPGGSLIIVTPNLRSLGHRYFRRDWRGLEPPRHLCIMTTSALADLLVRCGFSPICISTTVRGAHELLIASRRLQKGAPTLVDAPPTVVEHWCARGLQLAEWMMSKFNPSIGEETLAVARKP